MAIADCKFKDRWLQTRRIEGVRTKTFSANAWLNINKRCKKGVEFSIHDSYTLSHTFKNFQVSAYTF